VFLSCDPSDSVSSHALGPLFPPQQDLSNLLDLLPDHLGIVLADLLLTVLTVVKRTLVLIGVPMRRAEHPTAPTRETKNTNVHFTVCALVFLFLLWSVVRCCGISDGSG